MNSRASSDDGRSYDTMIVGAGQAGLAAAQALLELGLDREEILVLDAGQKVGHTWENRWDSLRLFTPARYSALDGLPFPGPPSGYPGKSEVARYLQDYAREFRIPVAFNSRVLRLEHLSDGRYQLRLDREHFTARNVIVATGPFGTPRMPSIASELPETVKQLHSSQYRNPGQLSRGSVVVVGAGNSGMQIAAELAGSRPVFLSAGSRNPSLPQKLAGADLFQWLEWLNVMRIPRRPLLARMMSAREPVIGTSLRKLRRQGVQVISRISHVAGGRPVSEAGGSLNPANIIWATGYKPNFHWLPAEILNTEGRPVQTRGITPLPGLAIIGQPWQHTRGSALLGWVKYDARHIALAIRARG